VSLILVLGRQEMEKEAVSFDPGQPLHFLLLRSDDDHDTSSLWSLSNPHSRLLLPHPTTGHEDDHNDKSKDDQSGDSGNNHEAPFVPGSALRQPPPRHGLPRAVNEGPFHPLS
jgi:hypothetical protein